MLERDPEFAKAIDEIAEEISKSLSRALNLPRSQKKTNRDNKE